MSTLPTTVEGVIARMRAIDAAMPVDDGAAIFNRMYLAVTEAILARLGDAAGFDDPGFLADLDVRFAILWLEAYDAAARGDEVPKAWAPLFSLRAAGGRLPIQYALAGLNAHIEHDLPIAVIRTCEARDLEPEQVRDDYEAVNDVLAQVEGEVRRSFLDEVGAELDEHVGPVVHLVSSWNIDKARDLAWLSVETMWALRGAGFLQRGYLAGLASTVGMASRVLLTPTA